ncbi:MAG: hypothetical protein J6D17_10355, partial [Bacteroides sp.]|nr:hypothetical protein [Bacteroides sp.]
QRLGGVTEIKPFVIFTGKHCSYNLKVIDCKDQYLRIIQQDVIFGRLRSMGILSREGENFGGYWRIVINPQTEK